MESKKRKQIIFDIEPEDHTEIKKRAAIRGISMATWIKRAIKKRFKDEKEYID